MSRVWTVARQTFAEGIRMKIALVFLMLIGLVVLGLPFSVAGDGSLTGAVQSFLSYALSATGVLLGLLTIFMSRTLSDELVQRQIFLVVTKPIPRWQFILGKWAGISLLNAVFLVVAGGTMYGMVQYIRFTHPPIDPVFDRAQLENEVLVARHTNPMTLPNFRREAEMEFERNREEGLYDNRPQFNPEEEKASLARKHEARWRIVGPQDIRLFQFENVLVDRRPDNVLQLRYKTEVSAYPPDEIFRALWRFGDPHKGTPVYDVRVRHVVGRFHAVRCPADAVAEDNTLSVRFYNANPFEDEPNFNNVIEFRASDGVEVLFIVGSFEWNLVRLMILMYCKLLFLGAVSLFMTTLFSFPVACLASLTVYIIAGARSFLAEALDAMIPPYSDMFSSVQEFFLYSLAYVYKFLQLFIPDFGRYDAVETFVNGRNVSLVWVLQAIGELGLFKAVVMLGLAMLFFYRREVAELSV